MVVEFRPHAILTDKFVYTLKFKGETQSMRLFNKKEMIETCNARLDLHGYEVTDFLTEPQQYMPACCWIMSLIKSYLHNKMTDRLEMLTAREQLMEDIDSIIDGWWVDTFEDEHSEEKEYLTRILCDAVCKNFPTKWQWPKKTSSTVMNSKQV